jgi:Bacterial aa3 type cytochrome c oxidase subunit IV
MLMAQQKPYTDRAMKDHAHTYFGFKSLLKWSMATIALVLIILAVFVA